MTVATDRRMENLRLANEVRTWRKHLKADLKAHRVLLADVLLSDAPWLQTMRVKELLLATPMIGKFKADRILMVHRIGPRQLIKGVSLNRRRELLAYITEKYPMVRTGELA